MQATCYKAVKVNSKSTVYHIICLYAKTSFCNRFYVKISTHTNCEMNIT